MLIYKLARNVEGKNKQKNEKFNGFFSVFTLIEIENFKDGGPQGNAIVVGGPCKD